MEVHVATDVATHSGSREPHELVYRFGDFELQADRLELRRSGVLVHADTLVLKLLCCLLRSAGQVLTKDRLVEEVWERRAVADNAISVAVARLRKTLGRADPGNDFIATVYGRGYRFLGQVAMVRVPRPSPSVLTLRPESVQPFVGREALLSRLHRALSAVRSGRGQACLLMGEAGIGKTRVLEAFERDVAGPALRVAFGYCREGGDTPPLAPWLRVLREVMEGTANETLPPALAGSVQVVQELLDRADSDLGGVDPKIELCGPGRHRRFEAILRMLTHAAQHTACVLVLEDLHRADAGSLELLGYLLEEISRTRILVLATLRPAAGVQALHPLLPRVLGHRNCERIALDRLPRSEVTRYVGRVLDDPTGALGDAVYDKSEGNPFFMVELTRQLSLLDHPDPSALSVHPEALDLMRQRLSQLDADARGVLSAAAVIGRSFELALLQQVTECEPAALMASLDAARAAEVVVATPESTTAFAFGHELMRSVLYDALPAAQRRRWHARVVRTLEGRMHTGAAVAASDLAYHAYRALPETDLRQAVDYCRAAATAAAAASIYGNPDVVRYLRHALEALALMPAPSPRLRMNLLLWSAVHARGCAHQEFSGLLQQALGLAKEHGDAGVLVNTAYMLNVHLGFEPLPGGPEALQLALKLLPADELEARSLGLAALATSAPACYSEARSAVLIDEAEALARSSGSYVSLAATLLCGLYLRLGRRSQDWTARTREELERIALAHPRRLPIVPTELAMHHAILTLQSGAGPQLTAACERVEFSSRKLRHLELVWHCQRWSLLARINTEPKLEQLAELDRLHQRAGRQAFIGHGPFRAFDRAVVHAELGQPALLDDAMRSALVPAHSDPPGIWAMKVRAWAALGQTAQARAALTALTPEQIAQLPCDRDHLGTLGHLARAVVAIDAREYATVLYQLLSRYPDHFASHMAFYCEGSTLQLLGMLALTLGDSGQAAAHFHDAVRANDRGGFGLRAVEVRLQLADYLVARGAEAQRRRAAVLCSQALESAQRLGLPSWIEKAEQLKHRAVQP